MSTALPSTADCVVIGGGAVGCSVAYHLATLGVSVVLLEKGALGAGSTGKCAGGVRQQFSTKVNVEVAMLSRQLLDHFEEDTGSPAAFRHIGYLFLATTDEEVQQFERNVALQHSCGLAEVEILSPQEIHQRLPDLRIDDVRAGTWCPTDGIAGPNEVTMGYANAARRHGAVILEECEVSGILVSDNAVRGVETQQGSIATDTVINCAGASSRAVGLMAGATVPVDPYRRHIFVTGPLAGSGKYPMVVDFRTSFYCHPEGGGMLLGMSDPDEPSSFDTSVNWEFLPHLVEHATWRIPMLENADIATGWAGLYEVSPDHHAIVGKDPDVEGLWECCGFSGHGFMQAPAIGLLLAQAVLGKATAVDIRPYDPGRFQRNDLHPEAVVI
ncbi:MAG: NAD(P)/FAD-dependent oxidoreductase [Candidatus Dormibacteria bacterium]